VNIETPRELDDLRGELAAGLHGSITSHAQLPNKLVTTLAAGQ
jgi:hypothetical protein